MVLLWKPMFSDQASGAFKDLIVYRNTSPQQSAAKMPIPSRSHSVQQLAQRAAWSSGIAAWNALSPSEQAGYQSAAPPGQTGFNTFMSEFLLP